MSSSSGSILARKLGTFARLSRFAWLWLVPVWAMIGLASLAILLLPFRRLAPLLGSNLGPVSWLPLADPAQVARAREIGAAISVAARYAPFRSNCLPQAVVAQALCRLYRLPYALHYGAAIDRDPGAARGLKAHAWVVSGPVALCGGNVSFHQYAVVACFVSPSLEG